MTFLEPDSAVSFAKRVSHFPQSFTLELKLCETEMKQSIIIILCQKTVSKSWRSFFVCRGLSRGRDGEKTVKILCGLHKNKGHTMGELRKVGESAPGKYLQNGNSWATIRSYILHRKGREKVGDTKSPAAPRRSVGDGRFPAGALYAPGAGG